VVSVPGCFSQGKTLKSTVMATRKWTEHRFGELVKKERDRKDRKWTQRELADKLADKGINMHWTTIAKIEKGNERSVRIDEAAAFADVFGVSVDHLLGRRARPGADRDFALRQLHQSTDDAARSARVAVRDITQSTEELAAIDHDGSLADMIATAQKACDAGDEWVGQLAQIGGQIAKTRGVRVRVLRAKGDDDA
jgi:transcriptional regulator with XRE-family HTH domain